MASQKASPWRTIITLILIAFLLMGGGWLFRLQLWDLLDRADFSTRETATNKDAKSSGSKQTASIEDPSSEHDGDPNNKGKNHQPTNPSNGLDISKINPNGTSVIAGKGKPNEVVTITADGQEIGTAKAGPDGDWVLVTQHPFKSLDPVIAFKQGAPKKSVAVADAGTKAAETSNDAKTSDSKKTATAAAVNAGLVRKLEDLVETARRQAPKPKRDATTVDDLTKTIEPPPAPAPAAAAAPPKNQSENEIARPAKESREQPPNQRAGKLPEDTPPDSGPAEKHRITAFSSTLPEAQIKPDPKTERERRNPAQNEQHVPIPIGFAYREANLTKEGREAIALLSEYLSLKKFTRVVLTGHADERGTRTLNKALSQDRLDVVAKHLKDNGFDGELLLIPKGESEPFSDIDRRRFTPDELYKLDRRVELRQVH